MDKSIDLNAMFNDIVRSFEENKAKKRILAVDDDRYFLGLVKKVLSDDYDIATANNGRMAIQYLASKSADLILLDYAMPEVSGAEVLEKIREKPETANIPVIFLTGVSDSDKVKEVLKNRPNDYMLKPIDIERLKKKVKSILG